MRFKRLLVSLAALFLGMLLVSLWVIPSGFFNFGFEPMQVLPESTAPIVETSKLEGPASDSTRIQFYVGLSLRNESQLDQFIDEVNDPASASYGRYLSAQEFIDNYSPSQDDVTKVVAFLVDHNMTVLEVTPNRTLVYVDATIEQIEDAFDVEMNRYSIDEDGTTVFYTSNSSDPSIPKRLENVIDGIVGLNTYAHLKSNALENTDEMQPNASGTPRGLSPQDVAQVYDFPNANNSNATTVYTGQGKTLAIATAHAYDQKDMDDYWKQYGINRTGKIKNIYVNGKSTTFNSETTLDLQAAGSQAPGADILMYMAVDPKFVNFIATFNLVVTDNDADVMSISWGLCESFTGKRTMKIEHKIFKQAASQGIAVFVASGDFGAYDCRVPPKKDDKTGDLITPPLDVDYPSSDPYNTAVGGTTLFDSQGTRIAEWAWKGSGGGESGQWKRPSWQHGPGVPATKNRVSADVALNADPMTGYSFRFEGKWVVYGGTSVGAPKWAALWILIDEGANKRIGSPNKILYELGRSQEYGTVFHDITSGDNGNNWGPGYKATRNWDYPTGWGVPNASELSDSIIKTHKGS